MQKRAMVAIAMVASMGFLTACGQSTNTSNAGAAPTTAAPTTLNVGLSADPPKLDPSLSSALVDRQVMVNIYDTLFQLASDNSIQPDLVDSYTVSSDGLTYTLKLKQNIQFQDGTPFNASAVKFNLMRDMDSKSPRRASLKAISSIDTPDDSTVVIHLKQPFSPLLGVLAGRAGMMVSPTAVQKYGSAYLNHPVGTGPYAFVDRVKGDHIDLVKNDKYWQSGEPHFAKVTYKIFTDPNVELTNLQSGAVQMVDTVPAQQLATLSQNSNFVIINKPSFGYQGIYLNVKAAPFNNVNLRNAVNAAINRQQLVDVMFKGAATPGNSTFSPVSPAYNQAEDTPPTPDAATVKSFLQKGGQPNGFSFTIEVSSDPLTAQMATIIQSMLSTYNIKMTIKQLEFGTLLNDSETGSFQAMQLGWSGRLDPDQDIYSFYHTGGPLNASQYSNPEVDKLLDLARTQSSMADRAKTYAQVTDILHQDTPYVFLYHPDNVIAYAKNLQGFQYESDGLMRLWTLTSN